MTEWAEIPKDTGQVIDLSSGVSIRVFKKVDDMPRPSFDMSSFMDNNLHYPQIALDKHIQGRVMLKFIVTEDGSIICWNVTSSPDISLTKETLKVVSLMPKWIPAKMENVPVNTYFNLPVSFKLER